ncbi:MAG: hypothetical protein NTZ26_09490 [Candidatus Aminicenantes bacterium]|nr:hypothetical protein [Candidatus Aminicenantes bacterium]
MQRRSSPRILRSPARTRNNPARAEAGGRNGSLSLTVIFLFFLFSGLGLGLVMLSDEFGRMAVSRRDALRLECAAENGVKDALAGMTATTTTIAASVSNERLESLRANAAAGGILAAEEAMRITFPFLTEGASGSLAWSATAACGLNRWRDEGAYGRAEYLVAIDARGRLAGWRPEATAGLDLSLDILSGRPPLAYLPFLLAGTEANETAALLLAEGRIQFAAGGRRRLSPHGLVSPRPLIPGDASPLLAEAMKIGMLEPGGIRLALLRQALGLPPVNEPVPDGVYLIRNDSGPGGVFVQGDLDRLLLAIEGGRQIIGFESPAGAWKLAFTPGLGPTEFLTPEGLRQDDHPPLGIVFVNGAVGSLSAATVDSSGALVAAEEAGIPCLRDGQSLTIVSTDELVIDSDLLHEGVRWADTIPYLKDRQSQLVVYAGSRDVLDGTDTRGAIRIGADAPSEVRIQASLAAAGSLAVEGAAKKVVVSGGLQAASLRLGDNRLTIAPDERIADGRMTPCCGPLAAEPVLLVLGLRPQAWREGK